MGVITFPVNLLTTSGLSILLHGVISLPDATSCDKLTVYFQLSGGNSLKIFSLAIQFTKSDCNQANYSTTIKRVQLSV